MVRRALRRKRVASRSRSICGAEPLLFASVVLQEDRNAASLIPNGSAHPSCSIVAQAGLVDFRRRFGGRVRGSEPFVASLQEINWRDARSICSVTARTYKTINAVNSTPHGLKELESINRSAHWP